MHKCVVNQPDTSLVLPPYAFQQFQLQAHQRGHSIHRAFYKAEEVKVNHYFARVISL